MRAYINNVSGTNSLKEYIEKEVPNLKRGLIKYSTNLKDKVVKIKMQEAINNVEKFCGVKNSKNIKDSQVEQLMRYQELLKEIKKGGRKQLKETNK